MDNVVPQEYSITSEQRNILKGHRSLVVWFTGLSGSGKSTIANQLEKELFRIGIHTFPLDGDNIRSGINKELGFSEEDRTENLRRIAEVAKLFLDSGTVVLSAFITPLKLDRKMIKEIIGKESFIEVFVNTPLEECERRDVKGLYKRARAGEIRNFTGISAPYEVPEDPEITIYTEKENASEAVEKIKSYIQPKLKLNE